jgi:iron complex outermembrane receptor protein
MYAKIIAAVCLLLPAGLPAQYHEPADSLPGDLLQTVVINGDSRNADFHGRRYDGQARTERLLENIPGISLISRGRFGQEPVLRGMSDGQINITIGGMHLFGACTDHMDPATAYVEPNNMESLQVSTGPGFGAGGATIGGGMNFDLRRARTDTARRWSGSAGSGFETNASARQLLGNLQYSARRFAFSLDGIYRKAGRYMPGGNKEENIEHYGRWTPEHGFSVDEKGRINFSQYQKWNVYANALYQIGRHQSLSADYLQDEGKDIGYPALTMDVAFAKAKMGSLMHEYRNNEHALYYWQTKVYYNDVNHAMDDTKRPAEEVPMHMDMPGHSRTGGAFTELYWKASETQLVRAKAEAYYNRWQASMTMYPNDGSAPMHMLTIPDAQRTVAGMDISDKIRLGDFFQLTPGVRGEYNRSSIYSPDGKATLTSIYAGDPDKTNWLYNAFLQLSYRPVSAFQFDLKLARGMRAPTLKEAYAFYLYNRVDGYDYLGNPAIKKEGSFSSELNISFKRKDFVATIKGFGYFFRNYIAGFVQPDYSTMTAGANGVKQYGNISSACLAGASLLADWNVTQKISFNSNTTWQQGRDENKNHLQMMPPLRSVNTIRYSADSWHFFAEGVAAASQNKVSSFYGETRTPGFFIMNAGADKTIYLRNGQIVLSLTCSNIFNRYYYEHLDVIKLPREGRNFIIHAAYDF